MNHESLTPDSGTPDRWVPWFDKLMDLAEAKGITTSSDDDLWWDNYNRGLSPEESMASFLQSKECDTTNRKEEP